MKRLFRCKLAWAALAAICWNSTASAQEFDGDDMAGGLGRGKEQRAVLAISADGSSVLTTVSVETRVMAEQRVRMMERYQKMRDANDGDEDAAKPALTATNDTKPFTDDELSKKITDAMAENAEAQDQKINVLVKKDDVITTATRSFASLEEMLRQSYAVWSSSGVQFENARFETDTNGLLRVTLTPQRNMERYFKSYRSALKLSGVRSELKLIFPGKVVASGFSEMQTNATWLTVDAEKDESLDAMAKLYAAPVVITAELGGLKLDQPLESKKLWRSRGSAAKGDDEPPITDAGPGYVAEAQSVATTTLHVFPGGEEYFSQNPPATGAVVTVKFFAPKGRTLQSVSDTRVTSAVDNKGRSVVSEAEADDEEGAPSLGSELNAGGGSDVSSLPIELRLQLPQPDAQSIDKVSAEAVATTVGTWKEMMLTNFQANATNELDLSAALPGAKMIITKVSTKNSQFSMQVTLTGPAAVARLEVKAKNPENKQFNSYCSELNSSTKNGQTTRHLQIQAYGFGGDGNASTGSIVLTVRYPQDLQRERVKFELKALDLM